MDFRFTHEQQMWHDTVHDFMEKEVGREYTRAHDASREFPYEVYRKMAAQGWLGLLLPEVDGGVAADPVMFAIFCEAIAKYSLDTAACIMTSMFTATNISSHGTQAQKDTYLPPFLRGDSTFSISISEPGSGSDAAAARTKAELDGDEWVLNGSKVFCSGAHLPNTTICIMARTGEERYKGLSLFLLPNTTRGLTITKLDTIVRRSLGTTQFYLDDVRIPKANLIGQVGRGLDVHRRAPRARAPEPGRVVRRQRAHGTRRHDALHQGSQAVRTLAVVVPGAEAPDGGERHPGGGRAPADLFGGDAGWRTASGRVKEVSMAKVFAADALFQTAFNGMQALGGYSQLPEFDMERYFREAKHAMVGGGTHEIQNSIIAKELGL